MDKPEFILAAKAMETLEMYQTFYASSSEYQERLQEVLKLLRHRGASLLTSEHASAKFLLAFADALEVSNLPGEYVPLSRR
ncbi:hypothetical protein [Janthinobacterium sp. 78]|uniref:hypothetical protein n=1 Tax=Janthinobacterium sp. 78 TaxID=2135631 RepID=UPI000D5E7072|nr:hypothetical protein [Janthinobacterium sp. 78]PVX34997.1 hypothetical protein C8C92_1567 [Janthinobacterium sp. 78]